MLMVLLLLLITQTYAQSSLLLERACLKNPSLDFCREILKPAVERTKLRNREFETITQHPLPPKIIELVLPPPVPEMVTEETRIKLVSTTTELPTTASPIPKKIDEKTIAAPFGLVPLPKPALIEDILRGDDDSNVTTTTTEPAPRKTLESDTHILVFVSEFCVIGRERFVRKCHGEIERNEIEFCKSYPPACSGTANVIPVLNYCGRYFMEYPKLCRKPKIHQLALPFCFAFEKFCLPETEIKPRAVEMENKSSTTPRPNLQRCEDVVDQARKVCHPFPKPADTFNTLRCTQFLKHCQKFVDW